MPSGRPANDTEISGQNMAPAKKSTSTLATPPQPININVTSTDTNTTGSEGAEPPGVDLGNHTETNTANDTKDATLNNNVDATLINENVTNDGLDDISGNNTVTMVSHVTNQDDSIGNGTGNGTGIVSAELSTETPTILPILTGSIRPDVVPGGNTKPSSGSTGPSVVSYTPPPPALRPTAPNTAPPPTGMHSFTTTLLPSGVKTTTLNIPASSAIPVTSWLLTTLRPTTTTTMRVTTTRPAPTTKRSSTQTHHKVPAVPRPDRGGGEMDSGRGEIAGMDPLALGIGICIPVLLIIVVILSVFCYRK